MQWPAAGWLFGALAVLRQNPLFCDSLYPGGQREGPVLLCGEAEQGLPGTVGWRLGDIQRAGGWGRRGGGTSPTRAREGPRTCISSHGVTAAMSQLGNKRRSMH